MKTLLTAIGLVLMTHANSQQTYLDSLKNYIDQYVQKHEVVGAAEKQYFQFFPPDEGFRIKAKLKRTPGSKWFNMETSGAVKQTFRTFGILEFTIHDTLIQLPVYQSQGLMAVEQYKNLLFLPFTDLTSGESTYAAGRYIDLYATDVIDESVTIDFNKAYNPYCAYVSGKYNCPVPPKENQLPVAITAGEKTFAHPHN